MTVVSQNALAGAAAVYATSALLYDHETAVAAWERHGGNPDDLQAIRRVAHAQYIMRAVSPQRMARAVIREAQGIRQLGGDPVALIDHAFQGWRPAPDVFGTGVYDREAALRDLASADELREFIERRRTTFEDRHLEGSAAG